MNKILLIIQREYMTRVKKKSFLIMTFLTPLLMAGIFIVPIFLAQSNNEVEQIALINETAIHFEDTEKMSFQNLPMTFAEAKKIFNKDEFYAILYVPASVLIDGSGVQLFSGKDVSLTVKERISALIEKQLYNHRLSGRGIERAVLDSLKTEVKIKTMKATDEGEEASSSEAATIVGFVGGFLIYFFIFLYGMQVMRGVMEEKTSRIVEVIISSVKPFQLMMGKILGIAMVGLTQFLLWVVLTASLTTVAINFVFDKSDSRSSVEQMMEQNENGMQGNNPVNKAFGQAGNPNSEIAEMISNINFPLILACFIFYFLGGYFLYSALFAAIGSAVDHDADTQQFMLPITIPLILAFVVAQTVVTNNPDNPIAFWFSIIPLTSPIVMMVRIPFGVPAWQLILSMTLLVLGFLFTTWLAGKIYRTGILMYGKKVTYKELAKWLFYKG